MLFKVNEAKRMPGFSQSAGAVIKIKSGGWEFHPSDFCDSAYALGEKAANSGA